MIITMFHLLHCSHFIRWALPCAVAFILVACGEKPIDIQVGIDYRVIDTPLSTQPLTNTAADTASKQDKKIDVVDVFWYGCDSCFRFRSKVAAWREAHEDEIQYSAMPAPLNPVWTTHARIYLAARQLHIEDAVNDATYNYLHVDRKKLYLERDIGTFFTQFGVDRKVFSLAYKGQFTNNQIESIRAYLQRAGVRSVPALIIDGRFVVLENNKPDHALKVASALIHRLREQ